MKFCDSVKLALSNLKKRKGRTFLTSLAVAIGSTLVVTMVGLGATGEKYILDEISKHSSIKKIEVMPQKYMSFDELLDQSEAMAEREENWEDFQEKNFKIINSSTIEQLKNINGVNYLTACIYGPVSELKIGDKSYKKNYLNVCGYELDYNIFCEDEIKALQLTNNKDFKPIIAGRSLNRDDKDGLLISERYLKEMGIKDYNSVVGKEFALILAKDRNGTKLKPLERKGTIIGVIDEKIDVYSGKIVVSLDTAATFRGYADLDSKSFENKGFENIVLFAKNESDVEVVSNHVKEMGYMYSSYQTTAEQIMSIFAVIKVVLASLGIIVLFVASLGIINTMFMSIYERTKSIGIMKSTGASMVNIKNLFVAESASIGVIGGVMGILFSLLNGKIIEIVLHTLMTKNGAENVFIQFYFPGWLIWGTLLFSIVVAVMAGLYPASRAAKLNPVEALNSK